jgi:hypothetical protein
VARVLDPGPGVERCRGSSRTLRALFFPGWRGGYHTCQSGPVYVCADASSAARRAPAAVFDTLRTGEDCRFVHLFALDELAAVRVRFSVSKERRDLYKAAPDSVLGWIAAGAVSRFHRIPYAD